MNRGRWIAWGVLLLIVLFGVGMLQVMARRYRRIAEEEEAGTSRRPPVRARPQGSPSGPTGPDRRPDLPPGAIW